jgi:hypothetical protein
MRDGLGTSWLLTPQFFNALPILIKGSVLGQEVPGAVYRSFVFLIKVSVGVQVGSIAI